MATASSITSIQGTTQAAWQQLKLRQAERNADQAEQNARALRAEADSAQQSADRAQEDARSLQVEADKAHTYAGRLRQGVVVSRTVGEMGARLESAYERVAQAQEAARPTQPEAVINALGQVTGQVVNVAA